jgi:hypothetical protein
MRRMLTTIALLAASAATLTAVATAEPRATRQQVDLQLTGGGSFVLAPMTLGAVKRDTGVAQACCWTRRFVTRDGITSEIDDPQMTLVGKRGRLVLRNRIEFFDILDGWTVITGTWKVVRGTGDYAGLTGGGRAAGVILANGNEKALFRGFIGPK